MIQRDTDNTVHSSPDGQVLPWYALFVRTKYERTVGHHLKEKGYQTYVPCRPTQRKWADRTKVVPVPLFPNYIFCRFNPQHRFSILTTPEVYSIVGTGKQPVSIPDEEIGAVQRLIEHGLSVESYEQVVKPGGRVMVVAGPLAGLQGTVVKVKNTLRLVVTISLLQRGIAAEVSRDVVQPVHDVPRPESASHIVRHV